MASRLPPEALAVAHRARQQQIAARAAAETSRLWAFGWTRVVSAQTLATVRAAMLEAARGAQAYVAAAVQLWGWDPDPFGEVAERTFAATASDGRPLDTLLEQPALEVVMFVEQGLPVDQADDVGRRHLERIVATQVADAARISTGVAVANDRRVKGYIRHLTLPSCSRCIILAGQWYRWNAGFARHPQCDCVHVPAAVSAEPPSPRAIYDSLSDDERRKAGWSGHDQRAIDDGADLFQVVNYRRQLRTVTVAGQQVKTTLVGTSRRGLAGKRGARLRLTPEQIYLDADRLDLSRDDVLRQLQRNGYIL